jgi:hypothetical protein
MEKKKSIDMFHNAVGNLISKKYWDDGTSLLSIETLSPKVQLRHELMPQTMSPHSSLCRIGSFSGAAYGDKDKTPRCITNAGLRKILGSK